MTFDREGLAQYLTDATSVLLLAPADSDPDDEACIDLLTATPPAETNVLSVTTEATPEERLSVWHQHADEGDPKRATIVDARPGVSTVPQSSSVASTSTVDVEMLAAEADILDVGLTIARYLGAWEQTDQPTQVCVHSVTALLEQFDTHDVVTLVTGLNELAADLDAGIHYHLDTATCDEATLTTLRPLVDAVVEYDGEGWIVADGTDADERPTFRQTPTPPAERTGVAADQSDAVSLRYSFDTVLALLSAPVRRTVLYHLKDREAGTIPLDTLVDEVHRRATAVPGRDVPPRDQLRKTLVHNHLPRLSDAGVVEFDRTDQNVYYEPNPALVTCLDYFETLELG
ncbi:hypothetical protein EGH21_20810 [Halomicroarcula sp. F13]|uniref:DUF7344 domain-containing protein n=1 Tax=Haloarcula rubra TaxID=2487747 RepID=A0AAW4PWD0_9EURY|nr:hypothetical protein [Halomicroarcula rubra]MBX0325472.1 hypothetical protein [Halomicroarcula rubra]